MFKIIKKDECTGARIAELSTKNGIIETPVFMPVGTIGTVKSLSPFEIYDEGFKVMLGNTYHLFLRPGIDIIKKFGSLRNFTRYKGMILTDSGGFQIFSLAKFAKVKDDGVSFMSHIDGETHFFTPERVVEIQEALDSDIMMQLDVFSGPEASRDKAEKDLDITIKWAERSMSAKKKDGNLLFLISQGNFFEDLREKSAKIMSGFDADGYAIGGLAVGETKEIMFKMLASSASNLPENKPRYLMGVGTPEDIINAVSLGVDMFDCVMPTRNARNGFVFTSSGTLNIKNSKYKSETGPLDAGCGCFCCKNFSAAYVRHIFMTKEIFSQRLLTLHNLHFYQNLIVKIRQAIKENSFLNMLNKINMQKPSSLF
ncbi:MAG: tRNA guanosine(34) transglycosylase Tgt [Candidatus Acidulodesulfobacterium ferriphilum]|uniref:Queuine tRNA-ribosyltransferase n=1 Tax=Candidatus Acidulodesulfobacterium ferriphilum TaxID=2597223 RepID=A0A519BC76_9DELT|nr:MAG: tRNA guanosine(34) transglycosylase Tgt [Candidatus Acidulodesulfobacterium ferriphilum]